MLAVWAARLRGGVGSGRYFVVFIFLVTEVVWTVTVLNVVHEVVWTVVGLNGIQTGTGLGWDNAINLFE